MMWDYVGDGGSNPPSSAPSLALIPATSKLTVAVRIVHSDYVRMLAKMNQRSK